VLLAAALYVLLQAMWRELDALDAQVSAERAARAKLQGAKESH
jgi:hypothetical protein